MAHGTSFFPAATAVGCVPCHGHIVWRRHVPKGNPEGPGEAAAGLWTTAASPLPVCLWHGMQLRNAIDSLCKAGK